MDLDTLWQVEDEFLRVPQWSTTAAPGKRSTKASGVLPGPKRIESGSATLQVPDGNGSDSVPSSMPGLEDVSDMSSIDSAGAMWSRDDERDGVPSDSDDEESSEYDEEEEAELRDLLREAMDIASAHPEIFEEKKAFDEQSNDNQFLKALGALRGKLRCSCDEYQYVIVVRPTILLESPAQNKSAWDTGAPNIPRTIHKWSRRRRYALITP